MFNTSNDKNAARATGPAASSQPAINIIGAGTQIEGDVKSESDIRIDGKVKGTISSKSKIVVGSTGMIDGDLNCENADISGKVFGKVEVTDLLFLKSTGYLEGDIVTGKLVVEAGARFTGSCKMGVKEMKPSEKATAAIQKEAI
ncbi:MAG: polymer-forming cytoskeletal protein [Chitinophagales bacterium]|nr:polymer-forming cytoskeletal protein [Chitinophagales bacterium]MDW8393856.1 polymer-forming cytoskeletal protein [Chitinophagales bacterium]